jgi:hypothetical protein
MARLSPEIEAGIARAAQRTGVDPATLRTFVLIESGGRPDVQTGSYRGLLQLSPGEFARHGGSGNIFDPDANLTAGALKLRTETADFERRYGRAPSASELYMMHQQGVGGSAAHWANPDAPAWQNMAGTAEGRQRGDAWARQAIWGNVPADVRERFPGGVDSMTSRDFLKLWDDKVARFSGATPDPTQVAATYPAARETPLAGPTAPVSPDPTLTAATDKTPSAASGPNLASLFGLNVPGTGLAGQSLTPGASPGGAATPTASLTAALAGGNMGFSLGGSNASAEPKAEAEEAAPGPVQLDLAGKPVDLQRLMAVLNNRSKLGLA